MHLIGGGVGLQCININGVSTVQARIVPVVPFAYSVQDVLLLSAAAYHSKVLESVYRTTVIANGRIILSLILLLSWYENRLAGLNY